MAFRSVSRLSSAFDTKTFTIRPFSLLKPAGDTEMLTLSHVLQSELLLLLLEIEEFSYVRTSFLFLFFALVIIDSYSSVKLHVCLLSADSGQIFLPITDHDATHLQHPDHWLVRYLHFINCLLTYLLPSTETKKTRYTTEPHFSTRLCLLTRPIQFLLLPACTPNETPLKFFKVWTVYCV